MRQFQLTREPRVIVHGAPVVAGYPAVGLDPQDTNEANVTVHLEPGQLAALHGRLLLLHNLLAKWPLMGNQAIDQTVAK